MTSEGSTTTPPLHEPPVRRSTTFKGDVLRLVTGTGLAQIIAVLAAPILTRLYAPEAYGVAALFGSITSILSVLACMRYEMSIVLPDSDQEAANLLAVSFGFSALIACLMIPLIWFGSAQLLEWARMPELGSYLWLVPIMVLISGIFTGLNYWNTRTKHFIRLSIARVTSQIATTSTSLGAGLAGYATGGAMISAGIAGQAVATSVLGGQIWRDNGRFILASVSWREMWTGVKRYRRFPLISGWGALINTASWQLPVLMLGAFFSPMVVGFYALGFRMIQLPMSLIGSAISQVFFQRGAVAKSQGGLASIVESLFEKMLIIGLLPTLILMIAGGDLFSFFFGEVWSEAGVYTQILAPWAFLWFMSSPLSTVYIILEKQKEELRIHASIFFTRIIAITIGGVLDKPRIAVALFAIGGLISYGYLLFAIFKYSGLSLSFQIKNNFYYIIKVVLLVIPILIGKFALQLPDYVIISIAFCIFLLHFYFIKTSLGAN